MLYTHSKALSEIVPPGVKRLSECFTRNVHPPGVISRFYTIFVELINNSVSKRVDEDFAKHWFKHKQSSNFYELKRDDHGNK